MNVMLVGVGMGGPSTLTAEAREALDRAEIIIGAERLLARLPSAIAAGTLAIAHPERIAATLLEHTEWEDVCVVLSGDVGFHSGARLLLELLREYDPVLIPGISTPQYFAARLRRPWQDWRLVSAHGVFCDFLAEVLNHPSVLFLVGGNVTPGDIAATLCDAGLENVRMTVGENLSSPDEHIIGATSAELADMGPFASLSVVLADNDRTLSRDVRGGGLPDGDFIRGAAPMTKREVRAVALSLLNLKTSDIAYDIGAGTGSMAVEMALAARRGRVFALERDEAAFELLLGNREKFGTYNMRPLRGCAPDALDSLPPPDAAFIGGSGGKMRGIIAKVLDMNPAARLVISAIALETLSAATEALRELGVPNIDVVQVAASRAVARGPYHMLEAQNPVFLISGGGA